MSAAIDGVPTINFSVELETGELTFDAGTTPAIGATVTAGFLFDVPCRFDTDTLDIDLTAFKAGSLPTIPLKEVFLKEPVDA